MRIDDLWQSNLNADKLIGQYVKISGWGLTEEGILAEQLMEASVKVERRRNGLLALAHYKGGGSCNGDSGGRLSFNDTLS